MDIYAERFDLYAPTEEQVLRALIQELEELCKADERTLESLELEKKTAMQVNEAEKERLQKMQQNMRLFFG